MCICKSFRSVVGHGEAHNGTQMQLHWLTVLELKSLVPRIASYWSNTPAVNASQYYRLT